MPKALNRRTVKQHLDACNLRALFINAPGWDHGGADAESAAAFPNHPTRRKIERLVAKIVREHLIVYATHDRNTQYRQ